MSHVRLDNVTSRKLRTAVSACPVWCKPSLCGVAVCKRCDLCVGTEQATTPKFAGPVLQGAELVAHLNQQFAQGSQGSNLHAGMTLSQAGVFLRQFDKLSALMNMQPWLPCPQDQWCAKNRHHWAASIVNPDARELYQHQGYESGMILNPDWLKLNCLYVLDGNSMGRPDCNGPGDGKTCIPGCYPEGEQCPEVGHYWVCAVPPNHLADVMRTRMMYNLKGHNEIVIDLNNLQMPEAILGWFYIPGGDRSPLVQIRNAFVQQYSLDPNSTPVVSLALGREEPFQLDLG